MSPSSWVVVNRPGSPPLGAGSNPPPQTKPRSSTLVLRYQERSVLVPRPTTYQGAVSLVREVITQTPGVVRFLSKVLQVHEEVEISADAWSLAIDDVRYLRVQIDGEESDTVYEGPPPFSTTASVGSEGEVDSQTKQATAQPVEGIRVTVKNFAGELIYIDTHASGTIQDLLAEIQIKEGVAPDQVLLLHAGGMLNDNEKLSDHNIGPDSVITMTPNLLLKKPVIYLYPPTPVDVQVQLGLSPQWRFSTIYPPVPVQHIKSSPSMQMIEWSVHAKVDGNLTDIATGTEVAYLYWEAKTQLAFPDSPPTSRPPTPVDLQEPEITQFIPGITKCEPQNSVLLKVEDVTAYLDRALQSLGLHVEARTSFITYWLPDMLKHKYIALRFVQQAIYERAAPLNVTPPPDVVTRVFMLFQGVKEHNTDTWSEAKLRANEPPSMWKPIVGVDSTKQSDITLFRVLEWGGMETI